jgi:hypothetical protein
MVTEDHLRKLRYLLIEGHQRTMYGMWSASRWPPRVRVT